ncbi:hypothetical protein GGQ73_001049 [Rhizobium skierniewicense]|uniref:YcxB-like C-terminal domain-containing protein n=1 Tax=Rhizobium skierniewicense TaxID=984260 RepID=A0A7W6C5D2_9HYPH|nr:YcxB family protein [Rhizobium skierniewicense]MBB3945116.1 hypothetical protein [Rhizobium skierniewicense]
MTKPTVPSIWRTPIDRYFKKHFELSLEDHLAVRYARKEPLPFGRFAAFLTLCTLFAGLTMAFNWWKSGERWLAVTIVAGAIAAGPALAWLLYGFFRDLFRGFWKGFLGSREAIDIPLEMTIDAGGVLVVIRQQSWFCPWQSLQSVEEDGERYYFWTSKTQTHVLPKRLFDDAEAVEFASALRKWWGQEPIFPPRRGASKA